MSADLLRRAAKVLRERAETPALRTDRWEAHDITSPGYTGHVAYAGDPQSSGVADAIWPDTAEYIALMHPPVALALADLLDECAESVEQEGGIVQDSLTAGCVDVARVILREES